MNDPRQPPSRPALAPAAQPHIMPRSQSAPPQPAHHAPHPPGNGLPHHAHPQQQIHRMQPQGNAGPAMVDPLVPTGHSGQAQPHDYAHGHGDEPIELAADDSGPDVLTAHDPQRKRIVAFGPDIKTTAEVYKRQPVITGSGACRVRSFHGKYSDEGLRFLDNSVNHWLDDHPEVEVKFVTSTVMTFEGKTREPALVLNLWY